MAVPARRASRWTQRTVVYVLLCLAAVVTLGPFYWEFTLATHTTSDIAGSPPPFWIGNALARNYATLMEYAPLFWRSMLNSGVIAIGSTVVTIFFSALGGYAFARYSFPLKEKLFWVLLLTMLIPGQSGAYPVVHRDDPLWLDELDSCRSSCHRSATPSAPSGCASTSPAQFRPSCSMPRASTAVVNSASSGASCCRWRACCWSPRDHQLHRWLELVSWAADVDVRPEHVHVSRGPGQPEGYPWHGHRGAAGW